MELMLIRQKHKILLLLAFLASACEIPLGSPNARLEIDEEKYSLLTSQTYYEAHVSSDRYRLIRIDIPSIYTNKLRVPVYFAGCDPPNGSILQRNDGRDWELAYSPLHLLCLSPAVKVLPGESIALPPSIVACFPGQNCGPEFREAIDGVYRLLQHVYFDPEGKELIPEAERVSNAFELCIVPG